MKENCFQDSVVHELEKAAQLLIDVLRCQTGQSSKVSQLIWSAWNGNERVDLCDCLSGLDNAVAEAILGLLAARAYLGGDADPLFRSIMAEAGMF